MAALDKEIDCIFVIPEVFILGGLDVARGVVAIHDVPGEGDMGAVLCGHLEVADMIVLGSCSAI